MKEKFRFIVLPLVITSLILFFSFFLPHYLYYEQTATVINTEFKNKNILNKCTDRRTKTFLEHNAIRKVYDVTDFQGSDGKRAYLVASINKTHALGVFISYKYWGPYVFNQRVISVKLINS